MPSTTTTGLPHSQAMGMYISKLVLSSLPLPRRLTLLALVPLPPPPPSSSSTLDGHTTRLDEIFTLEEGAPCIDFSPPPPPPPSSASPSSSSAPTSSYQDFHTIQNQYHQVIVKEPRPSPHSSNNYQNTHLQQQHQQQQQPFLIENCVNCDIYILETTASVVVANCIDCRIVLGPCEGTVFIRDTARCALVVACHQFRTRGCVDLDIWLFCVMPPMIETTIQARFGCYTYAYLALKTQFEKARLWPFVGQNACWQVYDLTPQFKLQQQQQEKTTTTTTSIPETEIVSSHTHTHIHTHFTFMSQQTLLACSHAAGVRPLPYEVALRVGYSEDPVDRVVPFTTATTAAAAAPAGMPLPGLPANMNTAAAFEAFSRMLNQQQHPHVPR